LIGDQDRLGAGVMLGLRQQVGRDPVGMAVRSARISTSDGPAIMSMPTLRTPSVSPPPHKHCRSDDLGDRCDALRAVGERGHRLGAADAIDLVDAGKLRRRQNEGQKLAVGSRTTITSRGTPATLAGTAFISTEDG